MMYLIVLLGLIIVLFQVFLSFKYQSKVKAKTSRYLRYLDDLEKQDKEVINCYDCNGKGYHYYDLSSSNESDYQVKPCDTCEMTGNIYVIPSTINREFKQYLTQSKGRKIEA